MIERSPGNAAPLARPSRLSHAAPIVAVAIWAAAVLAFVVGALTNPGIGSGMGDDPLAAFAAFFTVFTTTTMGAVLVGRLPRNLIGWLLLLGGFSFAVNMMASGLADYGLNAHPGSLPGGAWFALLAQLTSSLYIVALGYFVPLFFPSGHLPSRRWGPLAALGIVALVSATIQNAVSPLPPGSYPPDVQNPLAVGGAAAELASALGAAASVMGVVALPLAAVSLVVRYRHAAGVERQQLKWLALVLAILGPALAVGISMGGATDGILSAVGNVAWHLVLVGFSLLPVAIGLAILRYRLYDIDLIIRRTLVYGALALLLLVAYAGSILLLSAILAQLTSGSSLTVAGSTLVVAALFSPVRTRVQTIVDRRFYRSRYDATRELADLNQHLRKEVDLEGVRSQVMGTIARTLAPASASIWLHVRAVPGNAGGDNRSS